MKHFEYIQRHHAKSVTAASGSSITRITQTIDCDFIFIFKGKISNIGLNPIVIWILKFHKMQKRGPE